MLQRRLALSLFVSLVLAALVTVVFGASHGVSLGASQGPRSLSDTIDKATAGERFSLTAFEFDTVLNKWLGEAGAFLAGRRDTGEAGDRILERYFELRAEIAVIEARSEAEGNGASVVALRSERDALENRAERILESRIADTMRAVGLARSLPLFGGQEILWPPVDVELRRPPRVLAVSPRDEIRLIRDVLLDPDLTPEAVAAIEAAVESDGRFSALVDAIGGVAAYPAIVRDSRSYASSVNTIAHEWTHHYLFFYPLGRAFFESSTLRTINETIADIVAEEVDDLVFSAWPGVQPQEPPPPDRGESDRLLFQLRLDVDALLAEGQVDEAERLMEEVRLELNELGRGFRRLNQAFFAFNGVYATSAASSSPIGPLLQTLRDESPTLLDFLMAVREVTSLSQLEAIAAQR